ncbi:uncharacterized protein BDR25DRAFT_362674 [Lindgomyces ingoldianus]|uniref:Uncharacterized protein n=1 Tax=Lindgomyces ingoldianus TaxID=673940 RepID=A0ACB6Q9A9_9PLEO|nr:uncharacterized protein BDR25DRAFT_362674 [Lindgomyces ingoldianus]KAF2463501.1 hypothetical protein BDR25DRAFT_362674 [Lindgomyces ingoldianus]
MGDGEYAGRREVSSRQPREGRWRGCGGIWMHLVTAHEFREINHPLSGWNLAGDSRELFMVCYSKDEDGMTISLEVINGFVTSKRPRNFIQQIKLGAEPICRNHPNKKVRVTWINGSRVIYTLDRFPASRTALVKVLHTKTLRPNFEFSMTCFLLQASKQMPESIMKKKIDARPTSCPVWSFTHSSQKRKIPFATAGGGAGASVTVPTNFEQAQDSDYDSLSTTWGEEGTHRKLRKKRWGWRGRGAFYGGREALEPSITVSVLLGCIFVVLEDSDAWNSSSNLGLLSPTKHLSGYQALYCLPLAQANPQKVLFQPHSNPTPTPPIYQLSLCFIQRCSANYMDSPPLANDKQYNVYPIPARKWKSCPQQEGDLEIRSCTMALVSTRNEVI